MKKEGIQTRKRKPKNLNKTQAGEFCSCRFKKKKKRILVILTSASYWAALWCSAGTPGGEGSQVTPSSTPRTSAASEEPRHIKTEPESHSLYSHHSTHAQVRLHVRKSFRSILTPICQLHLCFYTFLQISALPAYMATHSGAIPLKMSPGGHGGSSGSKTEPWNNLILA